MNKNMYWAEAQEEKAYLSNDKKDYYADFIVYDEIMNEERDDFEVGSFTSDKEALAWAENLKDTGAYAIVLSCEDGGMWAI